MKKTKNILFAVSVVGMVSLASAYPVEAKDIHYGNGVHYNNVSKKCYVNWNQTVQGVEHIIADSWAKGIGRALGGH